MKETLQWAEHTWSNSQIIHSYFFNARSSNTLEKSTLGLFRSLLWHLLKALPLAQVPFRDYFYSKAVLVNTKVGRSTESKSEHYKAKAAATFLWVALVVPMVNEIYDCCGSLSDMRQKLGEVPSDLHELFTRIFMHDHSNTVAFQDFVSILQWFLFALEQPNPIELYQAVKQCGLDRRVEEAHLEEESPSRDVEKAVRFIRNCSRGLIEVAKDLTVQFVHETVRDYIKSLQRMDRASVGILPSCIHPHSFHASLCHAKLAQDSLKYLLRMDHSCPQAEVFDRYRFARYAAKYWCQHLRHSHESSLPLTISEAMKLLDKNGSACQFWIELCPFRDLNPDDLLGPFKFRVTSPLLYACAIGNPDLVSALLKTSVDVAAKDEHYHSALHVISKRSDLTENFAIIAQLLVDAGADVNYETLRGDTPLKLARFHGRTDLINMLIQAGAKEQVSRKRRLSP